MYSRNSNLDVLERTFRDGLRPPPTLTIDVWADQNRELPAEGAGERGRWRTSRTPYLREIMWELSPTSHADTVVFMKGSQIGATEAGLNWMLYDIDQNPCSMLAIQPTIAIAQKFSKQRLAPSIAITKAVANKISKNKSRNSGNTILQKDYVGGTLILGGANSAASLRSMPIKHLVADEIDGYPDDVDGEGDPLDLALRRTANFHDRKRFIISTPTLANHSRIEAWFKLSDQRFYLVPCPICGYYQIIQWQNIKYDNHDPRTARLQCVSCSGAIMEHNKTEMLARGYWKKHNTESDIPGFHLSALYSPLGWYSWKDAVADHLNALGDPAKRKVWVNTVLGETFEDAISTIDSHWLASRKEKYPCDVPAGALVLTAGVDTQDDRLECTVYGWGVGHESWKIKHHVFLGEPTRPDVWKQLDAFLLTEWKHETKGSMRISCACIDAMGHATQEVYDFCRPRFFRRVVPIKGQGGAGLPIIARIVKNKEKKIYLFHIGTDQAKETIYSRLKQKDPGPGYVHFPEDTTDQFFTQLTAEKRISRHVHGIPKLEWSLPPGKRNEALDCKVYALAALQILNPNLALLAENSIDMEGKAMPSTSPQPVKRKIYSRGI